ncbi:flagellar hook assembly protein FlgD [Vibrio metschnikovii]|uniref:flagellar hook assembly protein FlgD n=1 Tax=Vibrio metschnikovii TaxID=28172 RepID=UPI001C2F9959|nr:flagellar hook capping FlgD N-terminal domain-containing protein [Vibrio metschnikovii]
MAVPPVSSVSDIQSTQQLNNNLGQDDFIKLFMSQLKAQDPLEPVNNQDFLAQMAQFSLLESSRMTNEELSRVRNIVESTQGVGLMGKFAEVPSGSGTVLGEVVSVGFTSSGTIVSLKAKDNNGEAFYINDLPLTSLSRVFSGE